MVSTDWFCVIYWQENKQIAQYLSLAIILKRPAVVVWVSFALISYVCKFVMIYMGYLDLLNVNKRFWLAYDCHVADL